VPIQAKVVTVDTPLGGDGAHADVVVAHSGHTVEGDALAPVPPGRGALAWTWWCTVLVLDCLRAELWAKRY
jgi:hypothetical protein